MDRFWSKVSIPEDKNLCWEWKAGKDSYGYGCFYYNKKNIRAHCFSYLLENGIIDGAVVMHLCNNPGCVNPKHLKAGTHKENTEYAIKSGTYHKIKGLPGEKSSRTIMNNAIVLKMREMRKGGLTFREIGERTGFKLTTCFEVIKGHHYGNI